MTELHIILAKAIEKPLFEKFVQTTIYPLLNVKDIDNFNDSALKQKLSQLVQRNLQKRITSLLEYYSIPFKIDDVRNFVKRRNDATHGSYSYRAGDHEIFTKIASKLEIIILKRLNYYGSYVDRDVSSP